MLSFVFKRRGYRLPRRGGRREHSISRFDVSQPITKLLLRLTEQLFVNHIVSVGAMFSRQALGAVQLEYVIPNY